MRHSHYPAPPPHRLLVDAIERLEDRTGGPAGARYRLERALRAYLSAEGCDWDAQAVPDRGGLDCTLRRGELVLTASVRDPDWWREEDDSRGQILAQVADFVQYFRSADEMGRVRLPAWARGRDVRIAEKPGYGPVDVVLEPGCFFLPGGGDAPTVSRYGHLDEYTIRQAVEMNWAVVVLRAT